MTHRSRELGTLAVAATILAAFTGAAVDRALNHPAPHTITRTITVAPHPPTVTPPVCLAALHEADRDAAILGRGKLHALNALLISLRGGTPGEIRAEEALIPVYTPVPFTRAERACRATASR